MRTDEKQRYGIYTAVFGMIMETEAYQLPIDFDWLSVTLGVEVVPLSDITRDTGMTAGEVFDSWGNQNGCVMTYRTKSGGHISRIAYNDMPKHRLRSYFTVAEEITHYILKHHLHPMYFSGGGTAWDYPLYQLHEECARIGAGLIVCPPAIFCEYEALNTVEQITKYCGISKGCAVTRREILLKYGDEIRAHPLYRELAAKYKLNTMSRITCPRCGGYETLLAPTGLCADCAERTEYFKYLELSGAV